MSLHLPGDLAADLRALGVRPGGVLLAHASLRTVGTVVGGAQGVVLALAEALGPDGTLVVPSQSWQLCDPAYLAEPGVPTEQYDDIREALPAYDPAWTPSRTMGAVAEVVRTRPGARRSGHPHRSFAAYGPAADALLARHDLDDPVGEGSPLAALYAADAQALLLGVGYDKCTSLHLAEARSGLPVTRVPNGAPVLDDGQRRWVTFDEPAVDDTDFVALGLAFAAQDGERAGQVGDADARLVDVRALVDFAAPWFARTRQARAGA